MKKMKKLAALFLAVVMVMAMGMTAMAQTAPGKVTDGKATITIKNASKGETYTVYKLFDAKVSGENDASGNSVSISYTGDIPSGLADYFTKDSVGNITATPKAGTPEQASEDLQTALKTWIESESVKDDFEARAVSDGSELVFNNLEYGYYVVTTSQGTNPALTVDSTNPNAVIYDKNTTEPSVPDDGKTVSVTNSVSGNDVTISGNDISASIGDTLTYTLKFTASNFEGEGEAAKRITSYIVNDSLPEWLNDPTVTSITVKDGVFKTGSTTEYEDAAVSVDTSNFKTTKSIEIPWVDANGNSLYRNGVTVEVVYTATLNEKATIAGTGNTNTFTLTYKTGKNEDPKTPSQSTDTATVRTYALAIKKVNQAGEDLKDATFSVAGITVAGSNGVYTVTKEEEGLNTGELATDDKGVLLIKGVAEGDYVVTEVKAPEGYNKLENTVTITATKTTETTSTTTTYLDENGNEVGQTEAVHTVTYTDSPSAAFAKIIVNKSGTVLPSTGGIGTTIFYVVGGILVLGAGVLLITKKRMSAK